MSAWYGFPSVVTPYKHWLQSEDFKLHTFNWVVSDSGWIENKDIPKLWIIQSYSIGAPG